MNKHFLLTSLIVVGLFPERCALHAESDPASKDAAKPGVAELETLQKEFDQRRADALREVDSWYRSRLEELRDSLSEQSPAAKAVIADAITNAKEKFWQDDQPELQRALLASPWLWRSEDDENGVTVVFHGDGSVEHIGMKGTWRITGPCEVTIATDADELFILRFDASLSRYEAQRRNVAGHRLATNQ